MCRVVLDIPPRAQSNTQLLRTPILKQHKLYIPICIGIYVYRHVGTCEDQFISRRASEMVVCFYAPGHRTMAEDAAGYFDAVPHQTAWLERVRGHRCARARLSSSSLSIYLSGFSDVPAYRYIYILYTNSAPKNPLLFQPTQNYSDTLTISSIPTHTYVYIYLSI